MPVVVFLGGVVYLIVILLFCCEVLWQDSEVELTFVCS